MVQNYYSLVRKVKDLRRNYKNLTLDQKLDLLSLELKLEAKCLSASDCHTKAEKQALKSKKLEIRKHNENNQVQSK
ncbi:hypothetical protein CLPUN_08130 [Clostridium puniceum]|uniref:Uncharacterized protein n=1 Tax=Clostridium puniceum TaxID=29367 RepID=A0A1S8TWR5_9CLOT|nr:hypothetical protein [Clostridium puniceum]OOM81835.1 hypothetical protein CLPUN_08130 [Clostridium puniceum]